MRYYKSNYNLLKKSISSLLFICTLIIFSCKEDDSSLESCVTCNSPQTTPFEVCENSNGNATVNGEDTDTQFDLYITDLREAGATCGGA